MAKNDRPKSADRKQVDPVRASRMALDRPISLELVGEEQRSGGEMLVRIRTCTSAELSQSGHWLSDDALEAVARFLVDLVHEDHGAGVNDDADKSP